MNKMCNQCDGSGLILLKKDGKVIPYAWTYCDCREEPHDYFRQVRPEDFDFPMSYDFYRSLCQLHGWNDPGDDRISIKEEPKAIFRPRPVDDEIDQLKAGYLHLQKTLNELTAKKKVDNQKYDPF